MKAISKTLQICVTFVFVLALAASLVGPAMAQGTVPCGTVTDSGDPLSGQLNACTGTVAFGAGGCVGVCQVTPFFTGPGAANVPAGLIAGINLKITNPPGITGVMRTTICFAGTGVIRYYDTTLGRWVRITRTFTQLGQTCFTGRITGDIGLFSQ